MSKKLRYGPRFRSSAVSVGYRYSEWLHKGMVPPAQIPSASAGVGGSQKGVLRCSGGIWS
jgi:hypothetical protein